MRSLACVCHEEEASEVAKNEMPEKGLGFAQSKSSKTLVIEVTCRTRVHACTKRKFLCRGQTQVSHFSFLPTCVSSDWNISSHHDPLLTNL